MVEKETHKGGMGMAGRRRTFVAKEAAAVIADIVGKSRVFTFDNQIRTLTQDTQVRIFNIN